MRPVILLCLASLLCASEDEAAKSQRARELTVAGRVEDAIPIYQELSRAHPDDAALLANLSIAEFKAKRYSDAANHAASAVRLQPDSLPANLILGSSYLEIGDPARAVPPLERVLAIQPRERNALLMLAESLFRLGQYEDAAVRYKNAGQLAPESPKVWYGLGRTYGALSENAFHQIENASPYWHAVQADLFMMQRRYGSAFAQYQQALKAVPVLPGAHASLAIIYQRTGHSDWAEVEEQRERGSRLDFGIARAAYDFAARRFDEIAQSTAPLTMEERYWIGKTYAELAVESYRRLAQLPPSLETHLQKAKSLDEQGLAQEAAVEWRAALKLAPDDSSIGTALAWSLFRAHDFHAAGSVLTELLKRKGDSAELNFLNGAALANLGEPDKAIPPLETAARLDSGFLPAQAALGQALLEAGKPELAILHLKAALAEDEDASAHFRLFRAYQLTGQTDLAAQAKLEYQAALKLSQSRLKFEEGGEVTAPVP